jgi:uncharacterized protein YbcI
MSEAWAPVSGRDGRRSDGHGLEAYASFGEACEIGLDGVEPRDAVHERRGPDEVRVFIVRDMLVVRLKGVLTPAERQLAKTAEGIDMVKRLRQNLIAQGRERLCEQVADLIGARITALFTDIDTVVGERIFVFTLESDLEANFR